MNNEQQQIIDEVFGEYSIMVWRITNIPLYDKEEFINKCKTDKTFSEKWGLKIEERELSLSKRGELFRKIYPEKSLNDFSSGGMEVQSIRCQLNTRYNNSNIPIKLITITYNNETIKSYE